VPSTNSTRDKDDRVTQPPFEDPRWIREIVRFLPLKSQFLLTGNVRDFHLVEVEVGKVVPQPLPNVLGSVLRKKGFIHCLTFDLVAGFKYLPNLGQDPQTESKILASLVPAEDGNSPARTPMERLADVVITLTTWIGEPTALIVDFASRLIQRREALNAQEQTLFTRAFVSAIGARARPYGEKSQRFFNPIFWVAEREGDLPDWLSLDNPRLRHISVGKPDSRLRRVLAASLVRSIPGYTKLEPEQSVETVESFVDGTDGFLLSDMVSVQQLSLSEGLGIEQIQEAVRRYKIGVSEDPWVRIDRKRIQKAPEFFRRRVKGQEHAITHILDVVKRAITGVGASKRGGRPRGIAFLAGPTGVGKTEVAKTLTSLLFGEETAYIRFDMSEFTAEHSDQRLIGAPPGYVGYDVDLPDILYQPQ
jgi:hypothetical protein